MSGPEDGCAFSGDCVCGHDPEDHGWLGCEAEGYCSCGAHWIDV